MSAPRKPQGGPADPAAIKPDVPLDVAYWAALHRRWFDPDDFAACLSQALTAINLADGGYVPTPPGGAETREEVERYLGFCKDIVAVSASRRAH